MIRFLVLVAGRSTHTLLVGDAVHALLPRADSVALEEFRVCAANLEPRHRAWTAVAELHTAQQGREKESECGYESGCGSFASRAPSSVARQHAALGRRALPTDVLQHLLTTLFVEADLRDEDVNLVRVCHCCLHKIVSGGRETSRRSWMGFRRCRTANDRGGNNLVGQSCYTTWKEGEFCQLLSPRCWKHCSSAGTVTHYYHYYYYYIVHYIALPLQEPIPTVVHCFVHYCRARHVMLLSKLLRIGHSTKQTSPFIM